MTKAGAGTLSGIKPQDLAYAVGRLIAAGKVTAAEVARLAAERAARILALESELAALRVGRAPAAAPAKRPQAPARPAAPAKAVAKPAKKAAKKAAKRAAKKAAKARTQGKVIIRSDGRRFTNTPKAMEARRVQGQYLGFLRQVPPEDKDLFRAIAKEKGVPAAVEELRKALGKK